MTIKALGDSAILVEFEQVIHPKINAKVIQLHKALKKAALKGVTFSTAAYCSLTIGFNPQETTFDFLKGMVEKWNVEPQKNIAGQGSLIRVPVCYEAEFAPDLEEVSQQTGLSPQEIIALHTDHSFRVYMLGFLPGFAYMGPVPDRLYCRRKAHPRAKIPVGAVALAGQQTGIYPVVSPGGWQIIGRTPIRPFQPEKAAPFFFHPGDLIRFFPISKEMFLNYQID